MPAQPSDVSSGTANQATGYYGAVYAPRDSDLAAAIEEAQTVAALPADDTRRGAARPHSPSKRPSTSRRTRWR
ncbi:hypothetical protein OH809_13725 [Streptomyces sp. NBC_00873]|uniref:hypothetical protein n=1 Tax=unclassified Streptomyces TaxID=2593676 RepID=UPI00386D8AA0|nr:hypothetical protein OH809_13725 [Streptomyces sp. NBC_00873]WTA49111.1 hypothetical protein OH821_30085 [Streptomyces sp. NBC_00842]